MDAVVVAAVPSEDGRTGGGGVEWLDGDEDGGVGGGGVG